MKRTLFTFAVLGLSLMGGLLVPQMKGDDWDKKTVVSVAEPIDVTGTVLAPGRYVFKLMDSGDRNIVLIYNDEESKLIAAVAAIPASHLERSSHSEFTFGETPAGQPRTLHSWFYPGNIDGLEFPSR